MNFLEHHKLILTPLSPIHVGCGDDYEPTHFVIRGGFMHVFDPSLLKIAASERKDLLDACDRRGDAAVRAVQKFFHDRAERCMAIAHSRIPVSPGVEEKYRGCIGQVANRESHGRQVVNMLNIARTASNPFSHQPILPGSSLKGSIRTAILDSLNNGTMRNMDKRDNRLFQKELLGGDFASDPMRLVKVSDASGNAARKVLFQVNRRKRDSSAAQNQELFLECLTPQRESRLISELTLQVNPKPLATQPKQIKDCPTKSISLSEIIQACNRQAAREIQREISEGQKLSWFSSEWIGLVKSILASLAVKEGRAFLLRVGRHSGAESVTVAGVRKIKIMGKKGEMPRDLDHALTTWLAADTKGQEGGLLPFGWILVEVNNPVAELEPLLALLPDLSQQQYNIPPTVALPTIDTKPLIKASNFVVPDTANGRRITQFAVEFKPLHDAGRPLDSRKKEYQGLLAKWRNLISDLPRWSPEEKESLATYMRQYGPVLLDEKTWMAFEAKLPKL